MIRGSDVTVVIPTIEGREELLRRAEASVKAQQVQPGFYTIQYDVERRGAAWARNQALTRVTTDWVAWLDDDDELLPNHLRVLVKAANTSRADLVFSYAEFVGGRDPLACCHNGRLIAEPLNVAFGPQQQVHMDTRGGTLCPYCGYERGNFIPITYIVKTEMARRVGGMPEPYSLGDIGSGDCEDFLFLLRLLDAGAKFHHVPTRTWRYHYHTGNLGGRGVNRMHEMGTE